MKKLILAFVMIITFVLVINAGRIQDKEINDTINKLTSPRNSPQKTDQPDQPGDKTEPQLAPQFYERYDGKTILHTSDDLEKIKQYIKQGGNVNEAALDGKTPLHFFRTQEIMEFLVENGADLNARDIEGNTPLMSMLDWQPDQRKAQEEYDSGTRNKENSQELKILKAAHYLINKGADTKLKNNANRNLLHIICGNFTFAGYFSLVDQETEELVKVLIEKGVDLKAIDQSGKTPLHSLTMSSSNGCCVNLLIKNGADINARDDVGHTPIFLCSDKKTVEILIDNGADVNSEDYYGNTPIRLLRTDYNNGMLDFMISKGADINAVDREGISVVYWIIRGYNPQATNESEQSLINRLIRYKARLDYKDIDGKTLLFCATTPTMVELLTAKGLNPDQRDIDGRNALYETWNPEIRKALVKAGAKPDIKDKDGISIIENDKKEFKDMTPGEGLPSAGLPHKNQPEFKLFPQFISAIQRMDSAKIKSMLKKNPKLVNYYTKMRIDYKEFSAELPTPLEAAMLTRRMDIIRLLIDSGADVNFNNDDETPLVFAVGIGNVEIAALLLEKGASLKEPEKNKEKTGPLALAIFSMHDAMIKLLVKKGIDLRCEGSDMPPLFAAAYRENIKMIDFLLSKGVDINIKDDQGKNILNGSVVISPAIRRYLISKGANINQTDSDGDAEMFIAAENGNIPMLKYLISQKANLNIRDKEGKTALHKIKYPDVAKVLIKAGADINAEDKFGRTPLMAAQNKAMADYLLSAGAKVKQTDKYGASLLHIAAAEDNNANLLRFISNGINVNIRDKEGRTPLHYVIKYGSCDMSGTNLSILLMHKADPNLADNKGMTSLHYAARTQEPAKLEKLLKSGANPNLKDKLGNTPLHYAAAFQKDYFIDPRILIKAGADPNIRNNKGETPADVARKSKNPGKGRFLRRFQIGIDNQTGESKKTKI
jgi:ankyrin repeat protein